jgi:competence protein ComEC
VLKVTSQAGSILLTGDIEKSDELELINLDENKLKSDVLVGPHHGSKTSSTPDFISVVAPGVSIFTNGYLNRFGHPKSEVYERYQTTKGLLYRSDYNGAIEMDFVNHHPIQILSWRNQDKRYWHDSFESAN